MIGSVFFGYASTPEISRDTLARGCKLVADTGIVQAISWEDLKVGGRVIIKEILASIDRAELAAFDVSTLNENVLFELGYAIGSGSRVWLLIDDGDARAKDLWKQFQLLTGVGYVAWNNSEDIRSRFLQDTPHLAERTLFDDLIDPALEPEIGASLFYLPQFHETDCRRAIEQRLSLEARRGISVITADPFEASLNPLEWYASKSYSSSASLVHFEARRRARSQLHNARAALVAGIAFGLGRPLLMLAEEDYSPPFDYQNLLKVYTTRAKCLEFTTAWINELGLQPEVRKPKRLRLTTELRGLRLGEYVAEYEAEALSDYFLETASFDAVLDNRNTLFVGRKGSGKTANMLQAARRLGEDARNLVVVIKPATYEFTSLLSLLQALPQDLQQYTIEALWRFLLTSEIASRVIEQIESRPVRIPLSDPENKLIRFVDQTPLNLRADFAVRFEAAVGALTESSLGKTGSIAAGRNLLSEKLHAEPIAKTRSLLGPVLKGRNRVAVLIDNLDKAWDRTVDLDLLSRLLLGLLSALGRLSVDFDKEDSWRNRISLTLATFLRSDIFDHLRAVAREPDKIPVTTIDWSDSRLLGRVPEERYLATRPEGTEPSELWTKFFCVNVRDIPTKDYILARSLPRPRDLIYFCNAAIIAAVNARHDRVEEDDVLVGEKSYSQFAFEALLVENGITISEFEGVLYEFVGASSQLTQEEVAERIGSAGVTDGKIAPIQERLRSLSFLGLETRDGYFEFPENESESRRAQVMAKKLAEANRRSFNFAVHPAFHAYLEING